MAVAVFSVSIDFHNFTRMLCLLYLISQQAKLLWLQELAVRLAEGGFRLYIHWLNPSLDINK